MVFFCINKENIVPLYMSNFREISFLRINIIVFGEVDNLKWCSSTIIIG